MAFLNEQPDGSGTNRWQTGDPKGRTIVTGPTGVLTNFRFLVGSSGLNNILPAPGSGRRYKIVSLKAQNTSLVAGVTGTFKGNNELGGLYFPQMTPTSAPLIEVVDNDLAPLTLDLNESLDILLSDNRLLTGFGRYYIDSF